MKRRKKPRAGAPRERYPVEKSGIHPYLVRFVEWSASRNYSPRTTALRADQLGKFIRWCDERGIDKPQDVTRPILERYRRHLYHYRKRERRAAVVRDAAAAAAADPRVLQVAGAGELPAEQSGLGA